MTKHCRLLVLIVTYTKIPFLKLSTFRADKFSALCRTVQLLPLFLKYWMRLDKLSFMEHQNVALALLQV